MLHKYTNVGGGIARSYALLHQKNWWYVSILERIKFWGNILVFCYFKRENRICTDIK